MHLDAGAIQGHRLDLDPDNLGLLQLGEHPIQHTRPRPAAHAGVDGVPIAKALRQAAPLAAMLSDIEDRVQHVQVGQTYVAPLSREAMLNDRELFGGNFHARSITHGET